ncbi:MAG: hypothetical protein HDS08_01495 [Bacteroides sp.]|nr:hypothetical protein [Bacteroides sp.]
MISDPSNGPGNRYGRTPVWMLIVIILVMLPVFQMPMLLATCPPDLSGIRTLIWGYPFYVLLTGWLAYVSYPSRPAISWILLVIMLMSHAAIYMLVTNPV